MKIYSEISIAGFKAWSGAVSTLDRIIAENKCDELEFILEDMYPDGMDETELNDLLWFDSDTVFEWLGIRTESEIREELEEVKTELAELMENYRDAITELEEDASEEEWRNGTLENSKRNLWENDFVDDVEELKEKISELEEELENI